jgi:hypothetical protein
MCGESEAHVRDLSRVKGVSSVELIKDQMMVDELRRSSEDHVRGSSYRGHHGRTVMLCVFAR